MKRKLAFFFICLLMVTIGISNMVSQMNQHPVNISLKQQMQNRIEGIPISYTDDGMGFFAGLITFGIGTGIGVPLIIRSERRKKSGL